MSIRDRVKGFKRVCASELRHHERNWRTHPESQISALNGILSEVGFAGAVIARELHDGTLQLIDGHARANVAGDSEIPVLILDVDEKEADKILATFDPIGAMAGSDAVRLDELLRNVDTGSEALQEMIAATAEQAGLYKENSESAEIVEDEIPEPPAEPITKPGDLWLLGDHRLLCGDSTKAEDVERLMAGGKADLIWTDPPYGVNNIGGTKDPRRKTYRTGGGVLNDDHTGGELVGLVSSSIANIPRHDATVLYMASPAVSHLREMIDAFNASGFEFRHSLVWVKSAFVFGRSDYHYQHEMILYGWGKRHEWAGPRNLATVMQFPRGDKTVEHPTSKPVGLVTGTAGNHPAIIMVDPFLGSGTTLIAAEQLGRKCYGMEISPQYCDVIVKRWETLTGKKAQLEAQQ